MAVFIIVVFTLAICVKVYNSAKAVFEIDYSAQEYLVSSSSQSIDLEKELETVTYIVEEADTLSAIAEKFDLQISTITWANKLGSDALIKPGQELVILPIDGVLHEVSDGDTIGVLADRYDSEVESIMEFNKVTVANSIQPGQTIIIPDAEVTSNYLWGRGGPSEEEEELISAPAVAQAEEVEEVVVEVEEVISSPEMNYINPVPGSVITQGFHGHNAVDLGAPYGSAVIAADSGTVIEASSNYNGGYGQMIKINHGDGTSALYSHFSSIVVSAGDQVSAGEIIGYVGTSGMSTGPHLHFEIHGASNPLTNCGHLSRCGS